jgi:hypothetical protein
MGQYKDPEKRRQYMKNYVEKNKDHLKQIGRDWREANKDKIHKNVNKWRKNNKDRVNKNSAKSAHKRAKEVRLEILQLLGNKCSVCGFSDHRALQVDHIHGGGQKERKQFSNYFVYLKYVLSQIKAGSKDYQLLCANHNAIKRIENKEQPTSQFFV